LTIWYSGKELKAGDRLSPTIEDGLRKSRFGIVIFSPNYVGSNWTLREFYSLLSREEGGTRVILPVLHNITPEELAQKDLVMAEMFSISSSKGIDVVTDQLAQRIQTLRDQDLKKVRRPFLSVRYLLVLVLLLLAGLLLYTNLPLNDSEAPAGDVIELAIRARVNEVSYKAENVTRENSGSREVTLEAVSQQYVTFSKVKSYYRNEYHLASRTALVSHKKNVEAALRIDLDTINPLNRYTLPSSLIFCNESTSNKENTFEYFFANPQPVTYTTGELLKTGDHSYTLDVSYQNNIRLVQVRMTFPPPSGKTKSDFRKKYEVTFYALLPEEKIAFDQRNGKWEYTLLEP
jgi:hypothetical protein